MQGSTSLQCTAAGTLRNVFTETSDSISIGFIDDQPIQMNRLPLNGRCVLTALAQDCGEMREKLHRFVSSPPVASVYKAMLQRVHARCRPAVPAGTRCLRPACSSLRTSFDAAAIDLGIDSAAHAAIDASGARGLYADAPTATSPVIRVPLRSCLTAPLHRDQLSLLPEPLSHSLASLQQQAAGGVPGGYLHLLHGCCSNSWPFEVHFITTPAPIARR